MRGLAGVLLFFFLACVPGDRMEEGGWIPSARVRASLLDNSYFSEGISPDGAPLSAEVVCDDFAWLLTHRIPSNRDIIPRAAYDQGLYGMFEEYGQADAVQVLEMARISGQPDGEGTFRLRLDVKAVVPIRESARPDTPCFMRTGPQDWILEIREPPEGFEGLYVEGFLSSAKYEDIQAAMEFLGSERYQALSEFVSLACGPQLFDSPEELDPEALLLYALYAEWGHGTAAYTQEQIEMACFKYFGIAGLLLPNNSPVIHYDPDTGTYYRQGGYGAPDYGLSVLHTRADGKLLHIIVQFRYHPRIVREFVVLPLEDGALRFVSASRIQGEEQWLSPDWETSRRDYKG